MEWYRRRALLQKSTVFFCTFMMSWFAPATAANTSAFSDSCKSSPCYNLHAQCLKSPDGYRCICGVGFEFDADGICQDTSIVEMRTIVLSCVGGTVLLAVVVFVVKLVLLRRSLQAKAEAAARNAATRELPLRPTERDSFEHDRLTSTSTDLSYTSSSVNYYPKYDMYNQGIGVAEDVFCFKECDLVHPDMHIYNEAMPYQSSLGVWPASTTTTVPTPPPLRRLKSLPRKNNPPKMMSQTSVLMSQSCTMMLPHCTTMPQPNDYFIGDVPFEEYETANDNVYQLENKPSDKVLIPNSFPQRYQHQKLMSEFVLKKKKSTDV
eukprot:scpid77320/ scgid14963/ 